MPQITAASDATAPLPATRRRHSLFSLSRVWALATTTLTELVRLKTFYFVIIFAVAIIISPLVFADVFFHDQFQMLRDVALGAMNIFTSLLAILATAGLIPKDIEDRTLYTILAKPVSRFEYLLGKLGGVLLLLALSMVIMGALFAGVLFIREGIAEHQLARDAAAAHASAQALAVQITEVRAAAFTPGLWGGGLVIYAKACLLASMTLFVSTFASSSIFTVIVAVIVYFIGHFEATAREYWLQAHPSAAGVRLILMVLVLVFPDLQLFNVIDETVVGTALPLGLLLKDLGFGFLYSAIYLLAAYFSFSAREI